MLTKCFLNKPDCCPSPVKAAERGHRNCSLRCLAGFEYAGGGFFISGILEITPWEFHTDGGSRQAIFELNATELQIWLIYIKNLALWNCLLSYKLTDLTPSVWEEASLQWLRWETQWDSWLPPLRGEWLSAEPLQQFWSLTLMPVPQMHRRWSPVGSHLI